MTKPNATIVTGPFAIVSGGNCTDRWMIDGPDLQDRANAAKDSYCGNAPATIYERGIVGYGIQIEGHADVVAVYKTREQAERALAN